MPFIVPGVVRYAINGTLIDRPATNVLDFFVDTTGSAISRAQAVEEMAGIIINEWTDHVVSLVSNSYTAREVTWVDLDSASGTTGSRSSTSQEVWPQSGTFVNNPASGQVAILVTKRTTSARGQRSGRIYLPGVAEGHVAGNLLETAYHEAFQTSMTSMLGNMNQSDTIAEYGSTMVVTHILTRDVDGNPLTGESTPVSALTVSTRLATQRRRLRA